MTSFATSPPVQLSSSPSAARSRTPEQSRKSTPDLSSALLMAARRCSCVLGQARALSARWIVDGETPDSSERRRADQFRRARAARIWAEVRLDLLAMWDFYCCSLRAPVPALEGGPCGAIMTALA